MTDPVMADHIYLLPLNTKSIKKILSKHKIDAVLPTMGGQTALNLCIEADEKGIWEEFGVEIIGVDIDAIQITEDREKFRLLLDKINIPYAPSETASSFLKGKEIAQEFGFPLCVRPSFTLGGTGASIVYEKEKYDSCCATVRRHFCWTMCCAEGVAPTPSAQHIVQKYDPRTAREQVREHVCQIGKHVRQLVRDVFTT